MTHRHHRGEEQRDRSPPPCAHATCEDPNNTSLWHISNPLRRSVALPLGTRTHTNNHGRQHTTDVPLEACRLGFVGATRLLRDCPPGFLHRRRHDTPRPAPVRFAGRIMPPGGQYGCRLWWSRPPFPAPRRTPTLGGWCSSGFGQLKNRSAQTSPNGS